MNGICVTPIDGRMHNEKFDARAAIVAARLLAQSADQPSEDCAR
jgi:hypothetical protein